MGDRSVEVLTDDAKFEAELSRLEALAESSEVEMYEAHDLTTATGHYSNMKDYFHDAIGFARRAGRNDHAERLEKRLIEVQHIFRDQLWFDGGWSWTRNPPSASSKRRKVAGWVLAIEDFFKRTLFKLISHGCGRL